MIYLMRVTKNSSGIFYIDTKAKKILKTIINDIEILQISFPIREDCKYTYQWLEELMRIYSMKDLSFEELLENIVKNGFFNPIKPGMRSSMNI